MRLKSLEIKGFKSFADKTTLNFDEGITGVIGPNGCGKSNIVDSIRWVIGEQKISHLRSENLESLVFNGSKTRSASGLAEVSLTFENTRNLLPTGWIEHDPELSLDQLFDLLQKPEISRLFQLAAHEKAARKAEQEAWL